MNVLPLRGEGKEFVVEKRFFALKSDPLLYNERLNPFGYRNKNQFLCIGLHNF
jgi:hypothetical protein